MQSPRLLEITTGKTSDRAQWSDAVAAALAGIPVSEQNRGALAGATIDGRPGVDVAREIALDPTCSPAARWRAAQALRRLNDPRLLAFWVELLASPERDLAERGLAEVLDLAPRAAPDAPSVRALLDRSASGAAHPDLVAMARAHLE